MPKRFTLDEAKQKLIKASNGHYTFELTEYKNTKQKIKCKCNTCGYEWEAMYASLVDGGGCAKCANRVKLTLTEATQKLTEASQGRYTFELIEYKNSHQSVKCKCNVCGTEFYNKYCHLTNRYQGCPTCGTHRATDLRRLDTEVVASRIAHYASGKYTFEIHAYENAKQKIKCECIHCGHVWWATFIDLTAGKRATGCPKCAIARSADSRRLTYQVATKRLLEASQGRYTFKMPTYNGNRECVKCKCNTCGHEWGTSYVCLTGIAKSGCPRCSCAMSSGEKLLCAFFKEDMNVDIVENTRKVIPPLELDIYCENRNLAIEFDGVFWHSEQQGKQKDYHLNKTRMCEANNIRLLHIYDLEFKDPNKRLIWESLISYNINTMVHLVHARKCTVKEIDNATAKQFCNENHLQGGINSKVNIGAYHESTLVAVMTFGKPRFNKNYEWELLRFCSLKFHRVRGIASKLLAFFKRGYEPTSIISYGNRRWCSTLGNVYDKMGFTFKGTTPPNYFYVTRNSGVLFSRLQFQKHKLKDKLSTFDESLSEYENMIANGYDRLWDCGNLVYEWKSIG